MRRTGLCVAAVWLGCALGCTDPPVEVIPDPGGAGSTIGGTDETGEPDDTLQFEGPITSELREFTALSLGDLDADGCTDLALALAEPPRVALYTSDCAGAFVEAVVHPLDAYEALVLGDLDGDGRAELFVDPLGDLGLVQILVFEPELGVAGVLSREIDAYERLWTLDLDGDARVELIGQSSQLEPPMLMSFAGLSLSPLGAAQVGSFDAIALGDLNGDGFGDIVTGLGQAPVIDAWLGDGAGGLASAGQLWPAAFGQLALGDLNGDGRDDLLSDADEDWRVIVRLGLGDGGFAESVQELVGVSYAQLHAGDVDADGDDDIVIVPIGAPPRVMVWRSE